MAASRSTSKQNVTIRLNRQTLRKAKVLAVRRDTWVNDLLAELIEALVEEHEAYERARRKATTLLDQGFHLGGIVQCSRDPLHRH